MFDVAWATYWEPRLLIYPRSEEEDASGSAQATLTPSGLAKLKDDKKAELVPGLDYMLCQAYALTRQVRI